MIVTKVIALMKILTVIIINLTLLGVVKAENIKFDDVMHNKMSKIYCNEHEVLKHLNMNNEQCHIYIKTLVNICKIHYEKLLPELNSYENAKKNKDKINKSMKVFANCINSEIFKTDK